MKRKKLSRTWQIGIHLFLLAAIGILLILLYHFPWWAAERKISTWAAEQEMEEITPLWRGTVSGAYSYASGGKKETLVLARGGDLLLSCQLERYENQLWPQIRYCPWPETGELIFLPQATLGSIDGMVGALLAVDLPEGTTSGQVVLDMGHGDERVVTATREDDVMIFWVEEKPMDTWSQVGFLDGTTTERWQHWLDYDEGAILRSAPYQLTLMDKDGQVLLKTSGTLKPNGEVTG